MRETRKLESCRREKLGRQKFESEKTRIYAQKPRIKMPFKNSISTYLHISESNLLSVFTFCPFIRHAAAKPITYPIIFQFYSRWYIHIFCPQSPTEIEIWPSTASCQLSCRRVTRKVWFVLQRKVYTSAPALRDRTAWPGRDCSAASFWQFQLHANAACIQLIVSSKVTRFRPDHYSSRPYAFSMDPSFAKNLQILLREYVHMSFCT